MYAIMTLIINLLFYKIKDCVIWKELKLKIRIQDTAKKWNNIINELAEKPNGNSIWSIVRSLWLYAWQLLYIPYGGKGIVEYSEMKIVCVAGCFGKNL